MGIFCRPTEQVPEGVGFFFLVGSRDTNPAGPGAFPELGEQGILLRNISFRRTPALVVGGGSSEAVLWAVYELAERFGVRYLLHGDLLPKRSEPFPPRGLDVVKEPVFPIRWWRTVNDFAMGPESWGMADHRPVIDQLAKFKFNRLFLSLWPWQPFVDLGFRGARKRCATLWFGYRYPITDDMPGRELFGDKEEFWNPLALGLPQGVRIPPQGRKAGSPAWGVYGRPRPEPGHKRPRACGTRRCGPGDLGNLP